MQFIIRIYWRRLFVYNTTIKLQSTLVISNSKGLFEILRDIRTSTYQIYRVEEKITRTTTFNKHMCNWTLEVRDILKILWKRGGAISPLFHNIFYLLLDFHVLAGTRFSLRDKRLSEISEVEITRVDCILYALSGLKNLEKILPGIASKIETTLKGKNLFPLGEKSFLKE